MLSGRYPPVTGFQGAGVPSKAGQLLSVFPLEFPLLPSVLKQANYTTVMVGKVSSCCPLGVIPAMGNSRHAPYPSNGLLTPRSLWQYHLGFARQGDLPEERGFDRFLGYFTGGRLLALQNIPPC